MSVIHVPSNVRDYDVIFEEDLSFIDSITARSQKIFVVDENVWRLYSNSFLKQIPPDDTIIFPINEDRKNLESVCNIYDQLIIRSPKKNLTLITIGGGILQDITGFVASTLYRGIKWIFLPTTFLAQSDSCIGSKTSLNYRGFKNLIGTFYPPHLVHIFTPFLSTLQQVDFYSGLGEVVKLNIMGGYEKVQQIDSLFSAILSRDPSILKDVIQKSLLIKMDYISGDEFDQGKRNLLNFGHCFGHAIEAVSEFRIPHGQAVVIGMMLANSIALDRGILSEHIHDLLYRQLLARALFTKPLKEDLDIEKIISAMKKDKKRTGEGLPLVMIQNNFSLTKVDNLSESEVYFAITRIRNMLEI
jgi:3-dehydroquinate synthase